MRHDHHGPRDAHRAPGSGGRAPRHPPLGPAHPRGSIAGGFLLLLILATLLAPVLAPADPLRQNLHHVLETPSSRYWLGTDSLGRDLLSRLLYGGRPALAGVLEGVLAQLVVAVPLGVATGYLGGRFDRFVMRVCDIVMSVPTIVILLGVLTIFDRSIAAAMITLGVLSAAGTLRVVRGAAMTVRQELYVSAAELLGLGRVQIIFRHILPRCRGVIIVQTSLFAAVAIGIQTGLTFLGLGPPPPSPTWGGMINESAVTLSRAPWLLVPAGGLIALTVLAFGILGDVVRDVTAQSHTSSGGLRARPASGRRTAEAPVEEPGSGTEAPALLRVRDLDVTFLTPRGERRSSPKWASTYGPAGPWAWSASPAAASPSPPAPSSACWRPTAPSPAAPSASGAGN